MQNDVLKNEIAPWQEKGRWFHITAVSDGSTWTIDADRTDEEFKNASIVSSNQILITTEDDSQPIDAKFIIHKKPTGGITYGTNNFTIATGPTRTALVLTLASNYTGDVDVWFYKII